MIAKRTYDLCSPLQKNETTGTAVDIDRQGRQERKAGLPGETTQRFNVGEELSFQPRVMELRGSDSSQALD